MPGKQVRIDPTLHKILEAQARGLNRTVGEQIEFLLSELRTCRAFFSKHGIDPSTDCKIVIMNEDAWQALNTARARHIMAHPSGAGTIDETIIALSERNGHEHPDWDLAASPQ